MLPPIERGSTDAHSLEEVRRALLPGPWCWPAEGHPRLSYALGVAGLAAPPGPVWAVPVVTVRGQGGSLWAVGAVSGAASAGVPLAASARESWENAVCALPRSLPVLWTSVEPHRGLPRVSLLGAWARHGVSLPDAAIDGPSAGLAFFLLLAARLLGVPPGSDVLATATVDAWGGVGPVEGLETKVAVVRALAPRVRRLVVAESQVPLARSLCGDGLQVIGVRSAAQAVEELLGADLPRRLIQEAGESPALRQAWVRSVFKLVIAGRREWLDWRPVEAAARQALSDWRGLSADEAYTLRLAEAVAARHQGNRGAVDAPSPEWLEGLSAPVRLQVLAHLVQQCADTGYPEVGAVRGLVVPYLPARASEAFRPQLHLAGAAARLDAVTGRPDQALFAQRSIARAHFDNLNHEDISYPLCEWLRLAAALGDRASFEEALGFRAEAEAVGAFGPVDRAFLSLAAARGRLQISPDADDSARAELQALAESSTVPDHVCRSAARWLVECERRSGSRADVVAARERLAAACPADDTDASTYAILGRLDDALAAGDGAAAAAALAALRTAQPGPVGHLVAAAPAGDAPAYVARFFSY